MQNEPHSNETGGQPEFEKFLADAATLAALRAKARRWLSTRSPQTRLLYPPDSLVSTGVRRATKNFTGDFQWNDAQHFSNCVSQYMWWALEENRRKKSHQFQLLTECFNELFGGRIDLTDSQMLAGLLELMAKLRAGDPALAQALWDHKAMGFSIREIVQEQNPGVKIESDGAACKKVGRQIRDELVRMEAELLRRVSSPSKA